MINKKNRAGTSQAEKLFAALQPEYVSVEERSIPDLLKFTREYAKKVRFYNNQNLHDGSWLSFLNFTDDEILELAELVENPDTFRDDPRRFSKYAKPHLAVLLVFLKLLQYPKEKFAQLTEKKVAFFYRNVLKLEERAEVPDQVHVIFKLAQDVREHLLTKGTLLHAGKDNTGADLNYEVTEDIVLNNAEVTDIKTIHFMKTTMDIKSVHLSYERGDAGFEKILCLALGDIPNLPPYQTTQGNTIPVDGRYLRTELYQRIKGKEKDELAASDANYITDALCFRFLKDFQYCLDLYYREMNRGYVGITYPEDSEWQKAYTILEEVHRERIARSRRQELKAIHKELGFESMMEFAFGEPDPGNMLYKMPGSISSLAELAEAKNEAARKYIEDKLCMTSDDFRVIMAKKDISLGSMAGNEVYALLEAAWTKKRGFRYPEIGAETITGYYADSVFSADQDEGIGRFQAFGKAVQTESSEPVQMGFAVSSPLLNLNEGTRTIEIVISCKEGTIEYEKISALLANHSQLFTTQLSVSSGWQQVDTVDFEIGKFIIKPELKVYPRQNSYLVCDTLKYPVFDDASVGKYLVFANSKVYKIVDFDRDNTRILLKSVYLEFPGNVIRLIKKLIPKTFSAELRESIVASEEYVQTISSSKETFDEYYCGKYLVDSTGKIFLITRFISACEVEARYCGDITTTSGTLNEDDRLIINKIWETIEPQYVEIETHNDISSLAISGIYSAKNEFTFEVMDSILTITYPEGATAENLVEAWEAWRDDPLHQPGRYMIHETGRALWNLSPISRELERTGEIIKRYESPEDQGIRVTYRGRPADDVYFTIEDPSTANDHTDFLIAGETLTVTPGRISRTANQIAADWRAWVMENDPQGFHLESKDEHIWEAVPVSETNLILTSQQVKKCEISNLYGVGIRVLYTGLETDQPKLILKENTIDLFEFEVQEGPKLSIKYPSDSITSANDLIEAWQEWKASELNNPGNFDIEQMGDGLWTILARTERDLKSSENQIIECTIEQTGIIARFKLSADYQNAIIEFITIADAPQDLKPELDATHFNFRFSDDTVHSATKKLTVYYPPLPLNDDDAIQSGYQVRHVQELLSKWNREYQKQGFTLLRIADNVKWDKNFAGTLRVNFMDHLNYISTVDPDGFTVKFRPEGIVPPYSELPKARVVIHENDTDKFCFDLTNDYPNNVKYLFIKYPTDRTKRTVEKLISAWKNEDSSLLDSDSLYWKTNEKQEPVGELKEFQLELSGTGQWEIAGISEIALTSNAITGIEYTDPVYQNFFEYKTSDVQGFTIRYAGPKGVTPMVAFEKNEADTFAITVSHFYDDFFDVSIGESLKIKYPSRADKRTIVNLLVAWNNYKKSAEQEIDILGFEIADTSLRIDKRPKSKLLNTGDVVREYRTGPEDGLCISYTGHRKDPAFELMPLSDFTKDIAGQKIIWDNGEIFTITHWIDRNNVAVEKTTQSIQCFDAIKLYENDAICLEALKFTIRLGEDFPPVISAFDDGFSAYPAVKILLNHTSTNNQENNDAIFYDYFKSIAMRRIDIKVTAQGLKDIKLRGNIAMINPANPFQPFGITPDIPAQFYFANREICTKKLDSLNINFDWAENEFITAAGLPDMTKYYYAYSHFGFENAGTIKNEDFEVKLHFLDRRTWLPISQTPRFLFSKMLSYLDFGRQTYQGDLYPEGRETPKDPLDWTRYYKLELSNQGFMKELYGDLMNELTRATNSVTVAENTYTVIKQEIKAREEQIKAAKVAEAEAKAGGKAADFSPPVIPEARKLPLMPENDQDLISLALHPPYTPVIRSMNIDYTASAKLLLDTGSLSASSTGIPVQFFRFHPFGYEEMGKSGVPELQMDENDFLLPQYDEQGYLFLGIRNLSPRQSVSLLFQMVSGSGDVNLTMPEIGWSYLAANQWIPFKPSEILMDKTFGLQDTGVIRFNLPAEATVLNTILPGNRCWIRAAAPDNIAAVPDILDIRAGSICVTYRNQNNDPDHLTTPLAANVISELAERDPAIKEVIQPYTSFNGKRREAGIDFSIRVSERLKHKNRALTLDDYEKLILAQFPQVYKVKCVPQGERALINVESLTPEARGEVIVIVILKNSNSKPFFPLKPKTPANILAEIQRYLQAYMPPLVNVTVRNPRFEEIRYRLAVKFKEGYDRGYYINILNEDIKRFLSPWAYDKESEISFGSSVYSSAVINYIENTDYVDYVANFNLLQQIIQHENYTETIPLFLTEENAATAKYPDSILVSAESHVIDVISTDLYDPGAFQGIGHMKIGTDFWISRPGPVFAMGIGDMEIEAWPILRYIFANIPVTLKTVTATVRGTNYFVTGFSTWFAREDSQRIWNALREAGYIDNQGNVSAAKDLNADDFQFILQDGVRFEDYLINHFADFIFQVKAADFDPSAGKWDEFSCQMDEILNLEEIKGAVLDILRTGLSFDGRSQYPFMVY
jgi:hypothetical protein